MRNKKLDLNFLLPGFYFIILGRLMGYKLLLADDSITIQKVVELILSEEDYSITSVNNGEDALEIAKKDKPDIILADIIMPKIDGYQLCERVKQDPDLMTVPVLLLAGAYESFDSTRASAVGADDYIIKPFESQELIKKVKDCIERGSKPLPKEPLEEVIGAQEEDLWASLDLTGKAEVTDEINFLKGVEAVEEAEAIGEVLGEELAEEKVTEPLEGIVTEEKEEEAEVSLTEEPFPFAPEIAEEKAREIPEVVVMPEKKLGVTIEPVSAEIVREEIKRTAEKVLKESIPSITPDMIKAELGRIVKDTLTSTLDLTLKDIIEKVSWEVIPDVAERVTKGIIEASITSGLRETIEKVAWEVVPDMAEILIKKEIERLKAGE